MAPDILATVVNILVSAVFVVNYRGWTLRVAHIVNRCLLLRPARRVMSTHVDVATMWVVRGLAMWSAIASGSYLLSLPAR